jgi:subtilisin-like proprotein convertase family protein
MGTRQAVCVAGNDDNCVSEPLHSTVTWCSAPGGEYFILVHGFGSSQGNFTLCVSDDGIGCPWDYWCIDEGPPPFGACCQCDGPILFCTQETEEQCLVLTGDPANFLGISTSCEGESQALIYTSTPGVAIPDNDPVGITDSITVTDSLTITDLNVALVVDHTWVGDLCVTLSKEGGPAVNLIKRIYLAEPDFCDGTGCCGCSNDDLDLILDDQAPPPDIENDPCDGGPLTGSYAPSPDSLSVYNGLDAAGTWTLWVNDNAGPDIGVLVQWSLHFALPSGPPPCEEAVPGKCGVIGSLDIKPGSCPNSFNNKGTGNGKLPVALVGTDDIDVTEVDRWSGRTIST